MSSMPSLSSLLSWILSLAALLNQWSVKEEGKPNEIKPGLTLLTSSSGYTFGSHLGPTVLPAHLSRNNQVHTSMVVVVRTSMVAYLRRFVPLPLQTHLVSFRTSTATTSIIPHLQGTHLGGLPYTYFCRLASYANPSTCSCPSVQYLANSFNSLHKLIPVVTSGDRLIYCCW